jgi:ketosteroid isomerase-like protein
MPASAEEMLDGYFTSGTPRATLPVCSNNRTRSEDMSQQADSKHVLRQYVAAVEAGDREAIRGMFAPDATWTLDAGQLPMSGTWAGRDTIIDAFLAEAMAHYEPGSVSLEITGMIAEGERVVLQWTSRARTREGRTYENGCIGVFTIREGMIKDVREYMDTLYASEVAFAGSVNSGTAVE